MTKKKQSQMCILTKPAGAAEYIGCIFAEG